MARSYPLKVAVPTGNTFQSSTSSPTGVTGGSAADITTLSLDAGSWLVFGNVFAQGSGASLSFTGAWLGETASSSIPSGPQSGGFNSQVMSPGGSSNVAVGAGMQHIVLASPGTIYLSTQVNYTGGSVAVTGYLAAVPLN